MPNEYNHTPMYYAVVDNSQRYEIVQFLTLRGAPVRTQDFRKELWMSPQLLATHDFGPRLLAWAEAELAVHRAFIALVLGCGVHAASSHDLPPAQRGHLAKLRGDGNTGVRMRIAGFLGVRVGAELGRLRRAASVWRLGVGDTTSTHRGGI